SCVKIPLARRFYIDGGTLRRLSASSEKIAAPSVTAWLLCREVTTLSARNAEGLLCSRIPARTSRRTIFGMESARPRYLQRFENVHSHILGMQIWGDGSAWINDASLSFAERE